MLVSSSLLVVLPPLVFETCFASGSQRLAVLGLALLTVPMVCHGRPWTRLLTELEKILRTDGNGVAHYGVATHHLWCMMVCTKQAGLQGAQMSWMIRSTTPSTRYTVIAVSFNLGTRQSMQRGEHIYRSSE